MKNLWRQIKKNAQEMKERERLFPEEYFDIGKSFVGWLFVSCGVALIMYLTYLAISISKYK